MEKQSKEKMISLLLKLADHIADGLNKRRPEMINLSKLAQGNSNRHANNPEKLLHVAKIIGYLRDKHFPSRSYTWILEHLPAEYKEPRKEFTKKETVTESPELSDKQVLDMGKDLIKRYKQLTNTKAAQPIKFKDIESIEELSDDEFPLTKVWIEIYENMYNDYKKQLENKDKTPEQFKEFMDKLREVAKRFKTIADRRFAVDEQKYEALILASSTYDSLNNSTKHETEKLDRWEVHRREQDCLKCYGDLSSCMAEKCRCACHDTEKRLTTKGLKWAIDHNPHLNKLDKHIEKLSEWNDDICSFAKVILLNPHNEDYMKPKDLRNIMADHIKTDKCDQCEFFLQDHPNYFDEKK